MQLTEPSQTQQLLLHKHQSSPGARVGECADPALGSIVTSGAAKTDPLCGANPWSDTTDGGLLLARAITSDNFPNKKILSKNQDVTNNLNRIKLSKRNSIF